MAEYKPNSNKSREEEKSGTPERRVKEAVVSGAKKQKTGSIQKLVNFFNSEEITETRSIITNTINAVQRILDALDVIMGIGRGKSGVRAARIGYRRQPDDDRDQDCGTVRSKTTMSDISYQDIIFETRSDAETVLWKMEEMLDTFQNVSIGDMFDLSGVSGNYTDFKYGWTDLRGAKVERVRDGYIIDLPKATNI